MTKKMKTTPHEAVLIKKHGDEIETILAKYPPDQKRSAVLPLLYIAMREYGFITSEAIDEVADILDLDPTEVGSLIGFYTLLHDEKAGKYRIQVCTDLPCALRGAEEFLQSLCQSIGIEVGETTEDGLITIEEVKCLAGCNHAPMFQLQGPDGIHYHENQTVESATALINKLRQEDKDD
ncbi:MAG: NAD(P)H-dependent oxidoreductase subunit E [Anaerolineales bacterium]|jgi:NADH-quinone oxidoreductase subunit E